MEVLLKLLFSLSIVFDENKRAIGDLLAKKNKAFI